VAKQECSPFVGVQLNMGMGNSTRLAKIIGFFRVISFEIHMLALIASDLRLSDCISTKKPSTVVTHNKPHSVPDGDLPEVFLHNEAHSTISQSDYESLWQKFFDLWSKRSWKVEDHSARSAGCGFQMGMQPFPSIQ
jgi:hypothetical protein